MKRINIISILFLVFLLASCKKDAMQDANHSTDNAVLITLAIPENKPLTRADDVHTDTDANSDDEKRIASATVLFYDHTTQLLIKKVSTGADGISWDHVLQRVVIPSGKLDLKKTYDIVVLANLPEASSLVGTITEGDNRSALSNLYSKITSPITVDPAHPLMMSGMKENHSFSKNKSADVALIHQAVKIRVNISLTDEFAALGADALFKAATTPVRLTLFNVPNFSYLIGTGVFNDLAKQADYALLDYSPVEMPRSAALNKWSKTIYAYENVVDGVSSDHQKRATSFVFQLPYNASGVEVSENYYKVMIEDPNTASEAATKYKTERNHLYDVNVKVNGFGSAVPSIDGVKVTTNILPWGNVASDANADAKELFELSNTECQIVGDHADYIVIAQAVLRQAGAVGKANIELVKGVGFAITQPQVAITADVPVSIRINVTSNFTGGTIKVTIGNKSQEIKLSKKFDKAKVDVSTYAKAVSSEKWCSLSPNKVYNKSEQQAVLEGAGTKWLHIDKSSLGGDTTRVASVMLTKTDNSVVRMTVVQQPYVALRGVKWATGNIELGHRADGTPCYVIGAATDYGLLFYFMTAVGIERGEQGTSWNGLDMYYPSGAGSTASVSAKTISAWPGVPIKRTEDPCSYIASADGMQWRTPTHAELQYLIDGRGGNNSTSDYSWSSTLGEPQGFHTAAGKLFFSCPGRRDHSTGQLVLSDKATNGWQISNRSSTSTASGSGSTLAILPSGLLDPPSLQVFPSHQDEYGMAVRCVRK